MKHKLILTKEEIIKKHIPNGIVNIKGSGDGKPQYKAEIEAIERCMEEYKASMQKKGISYLLLLGNFVKARMILLLTFMKQIKIIITKIIK